MTAGLPPRAFDRRSTERNKDFGEIVQRRRPIFADVCRLCLDDSARCAWARPESAVPTRRTPKKTVPNEAGVICGSSSDREILTAGNPDFVPPGSGSYGLSLFSDRRSGGDEDGAHYCRNRSPDRRRTDPRAKRHGKIDRRESFGRVALPHARPWRYMPTP